MNCVPLALHLAISLSPAPSVPSSEDLFAINEIVVLNVVVIRIVAKHDVLAVRVGHPLGTFDPSPELPVAPPLANVPWGRGRGGAGSECEAGQVNVFDLKTSSHQPHSSFCTLAEPET